MQATSTVKYGTLALASLSAGFAISHFVCHYTSGEDSPSSTCDGLNQYGSWIGAVLGIMAFTGMMFLKPGSTSFVTKKWLQMTMKYILPTLALISGVAHSALAGSSTSSENGKPNSTLIYITFTTSLLTVILLGYEIFKGQSLGGGYAPTGGYGY